MRQFIKQVSIFLAGIFIAFSLLDIFYTWIISENPVYSIKNDEHIDYLIAGDSRTDPLLEPFLEHITGKKIIQIGSHGYVLQNNIEILEYFFSKGNRVDKVILQVDWKFGSSIENKKNFEYMPHIMREQGLFKPRIPFEYYMINNKNIRPTHIYKYSKNMLKKDKSESVIIDTVNVKHTPFVNNRKLWEDYSVNRFRIEEIVALRDYLHKMGVKELILFSPPYLPEWISSQSDSASYKTIIKNAGFKHYDFSTVYKDTSYFKDHLHVKNSKYMEFCRLFASIVMIDEK